MVLDLEDSVPVAEKQAARQTIAAAWAAVTRAAEVTVPVVVRINSMGTDAGRDDLDCLALLSPPAGVMLAKAESASQVQTVSLALPMMAILPLVESARASWLYRRSPSHPAFCAWSSGTSTA